MKYTKEQLQAMSEYDVNMALAELVYKDVYFFDRQSDTQKSLMLAPNDASEPIDILIVDYCNTPNDIMPLAFERGISIIKADNANLWLSMSAADGESVFRQSEIMVQNESPLRAIACCLILVLQGEKE